MSTKINASSDNTQQKVLISAIISGSGVFTDVKYVVVNSGEDECDKLKKDAVLLDKGSENASNSPAATTDSASSTGTTGTASNSAASSTGTSSNPTDEVSEDETKLLEILIKDENYTNPEDKYIEDIADLRRLTKGFFEEILKKLNIKSRDQAKLYKDVITRTDDEFTNAKQKFFDFIMDKSKYKKTGFFYGNKDLKKVLKKKELDLLNIEFMDKDTFDKIANEMTPENKQMAEDYFKRMNDANPKKKDISQHEESLEQELLAILKEKTNFKDNLDRGIKTINDIRKLTSVEREDILSNLNPEPASRVKILFDSYKVTSSDANDSSNQEVAKKALYDFLNRLINTELKTKYGINESKFINKLTRQQREEINGKLGKENENKYDDLVSSIYFDDEIDPDTIKQSRWKRFFTFGRKKTTARLIPEIGKTGEPIPIEITIFKEKSNLKFDKSEYMMKIKLAGIYSGNPAIFLDKKLKILGYTFLDNPLPTDSAKVDKYDKFIGWTLTDVEKKGGKPKKTRKIRRKINKKTNKPTRRVR